MRIGVGYPFELGQAQARTFVQAADECGVDTIWVYENPTWPGAFSTAGSVAALTSRVRVGIGTVSPFTRNPVVLAMEVAQLQSLSQGRAIVALGVGPAQTLQKWGIDTAGPLAAMSETLDFLQRSVIGEKMSVEGKFVNVAEMQLAFPSPHGAVPIYFGTIGPKLVAVAARHAAGIIISNHAPMPLVRRSITEAVAVAAAAGRAPADFNAVAYVPFALAETSAAAFDRLKPSLAKTMARVAGNVALEAMYTADGVLTADQMTDIAAGVAAGADPSGLIPDEVVDYFCVAGDEENVVRRIAEYEAAGVHELVLFEVGSDPDFARVMRRAVALAAG